MTNNAKYHIWFIVKILALLVFTLSASVLLSRISLLDRPFTNSPTEAFTDCDQFTDTDSTGFEEHFKCKEGTIIVSQSWPKKNKPRSVSITIRKGK